jgi:hypothetical protein
MTHQSSTTRIAVQGAVHRRPQVQQINPEGPTQRHSAMEQNAALCSCAGSDQSLGIREQWMSQQSTKTRSAVLGGMNGRVQLEVLKINLQGTARTQHSGSPDQSWTMCNVQGECKSGKIISKSWLAQQQARGRDGNKIQGCQQPRWRKQRGRLQSRWRKCRGASLPGVGVAWLFPTGD